MPKYLSDDVIAKIRSMRREGHTYEEISRILKVSLASVAKYTKSAKVPKKQEPATFDLTSFPQAKTPVSVSQDSKNSIPTNGVVKHYIPDYRREIQPKQKKISYEYGGVEFTIGNDEIEFHNLLARLIDISNPIDSDGYEIPGTFGSSSSLKANLYSIRDIINLAEALVGIGMFFEKNVID